jgi:hypothetical protein
LREGIGSFVTSSFVRRHFDRNASHRALRITAVKYVKLPRVAHIRDTKCGAASGGSEHRRGPDKGGSNDAVRG